MEDLTKHQIILLALFVSFVTSIATGIVAVSLMGQAPVGVTQTINRIVERTIERVIDPNATSTAQMASAANVTAKENTLSLTVEKVSKGIVRLRSRSSDPNASKLLGMGIILSKEGVVVADKAGTEGADLVAVFSDGKEFPAQVIQSQILGDIAFIVALVPKDYLLYPVTYTSEDTSLELGKTLFALGGKDTNTLHEGYVSKERRKIEDNIDTTISSKNIFTGSPLFASDGTVIGIKTSSLLSESSFYPFSNLKSIIPTISR